MIEPTDSAASDSSQTGSLGTPTKLRENITYPRKHSRQCHDLKNTRLCVFLIELVMVRFDQEFCVKFLGRVFGASARCKPSSAAAACAVWSCSASEVEETTEAGDGGGGSGGGFSTIATIGDGGEEGGAGRLPVAVRVPCVRPAAAARCWAAVSRGRRLPLGGINCGTQRQYRASDGQHSYRALAARGARLRSRRAHACVRSPPIRHCPPLPPPPTTPPAAAMSSPSSPRSPLTTADGREREHA